MSLDITISARSPVLCPHCGGVVSGNVVDSAASGGKGWYPFLESIGYYVPYDKRGEDTDWYGKDMTLTKDQANELYCYIKEKPDIYSAYSVAGVIARALLDGDNIVVNADW